MIIFFIIFFQKLFTPLTLLLDGINKSFGSKFNGILVNKYDGKDDYINPHSDNGSNLDKDVGVVMISFEHNQINSLFEDLTDKLREQIGNEFYMYTEVFNILDPVQDITYYSDTCIVTMYLHLFIQEYSLMTIIKSSVMINTYSKCVLIRQFGNMNYYFQNH